MLRITIPRSVGIKVLKSLEEELGESIDLKRDEPEKVGRILYRKIKQGFERRRRGPGGRRYSAGVVFAGTYFVGHATEEEARLEVIAAAKISKEPRYKTDDLILRLWDGVNKGYGCTPIPHDPNRSIIARAIINGQHQHVTDVRRDPSHYECDPNARHEEVYPIVSRTPISSGSNKGRLAVVAVHDFDFADEWTIDAKTAREFGELLKPYGEAMYPGPPRVRINQTTLVYTFPTIQNDTIREMRQAS